MDFLSDKQVLGGISVILGLVGAVPYFWGIWRGRVRPHLYTWLLWTLLTTIAAAGQMVAGAGAGAWGTWGSTLVCGITLVVAWWQGDNDITRSDKWALGLGLAAIPVWLATGNPFWAVMLVSAIDAIAYWPTCRKLWNRPYSESLTSAAVANVKWGFALAAMTTFSPTTLLYPAVIVFCNFVTIGLMAWRRWVVKPIT